MHRYSYKKPKDDFNVQKTGYIIFGSVLGLALILGGGWPSFTIGAAILIGIMYEIMKKKHDSFVLVKKDGLLFSHATTKGGTVKLDWSEVVQVEKYVVPGRVISGWRRENYYEKDSLELRFATAKGRAFAVQNNFGIGFEERIRRVCKVRSIPFIDMTRK